MTLNNDVIIEIVKEISEPRIQELLTQMMTLMNEQKQKIAELETKNEALNEKLESFSSAAVPAPAVNSAALEALVKEVETIKDSIKNLKVGEDQFDLKKEEFVNIFRKSKLQLDYESEAPTGAILNKIFEEVLKGKPKEPNGFGNYNFSPRVIDRVLSLKEWITAPTSKFDLGSMKIDNSFDTSDPISTFNNENKKTMSRQLTLGTGTGKSTLFLRCLAFLGKENKGKGATLVVPYSSLIGSVITAHNDWLAKDDPNVPDEKKEERVIKCPICEGRHTKYETVDYKGVMSGKEGLINVFTWWEFLEIYLSKPEVIKEWVVFDEGHTDTPAYQALIEGIKKNVKVDKRPNNFKIVEMSATFGNLPTSKKLTGTITDYYVTDFGKVIAKNPDVFKKTVIVFCDDMRKINQQPLKDNNVKYIILNDSLKDYATDIVRSLKPPLIVFASRPYSVGFSFGDVNVVSTGVSQRTIMIDEKGTKKVIEGTDDFADALQIRGRGARQKEFSNIWMSCIKEPGDYKGKLKEDYPGKVIEAYFKKPKPEEKDRKELEKVIALFKKPEPTPELDQKEGNLNLNRVLVRNLKENLDHAKLFTIKPSEKGKREPGEYTFTNKLMKYFEEDQIEDLIVEATREKIEDIVRDYYWYTTPQEDDDYVFDNETDAKLVGFLLQAREKDRGFEMNVTKNKEGIATKLTLKFKYYKFDKKKLAV